MAFKRTAIAAGLLGMVSLLIFGLLFGRGSREATCSFICFDPWQLVLVVSPYVLGYVVIVAIVSALLAGTVSVLNPDASPIRIARWSTAATVILPPLLCGLLWMASVNA